MEMLLHVTPVSNPGEMQFDIRKFRDLLHAGRARYAYCFAVLNVGLYGLRENAIAPSS
jgi:hypothetical protein